MRSIGSFLLFFKVKYDGWKEERRVKQAFYHHLLFRETDEALKRLYRFQNPYKISKHFLLEKRACDIHIYGETPLTTLYEIAQVFHLSIQDHLIELGCGRGRGANFLRHYIGCQVTGIDCIPLFIEKAHLISLLDPDRKLQFVYGDFLEGDFSDATALYLYGTALPDESIYQLVEKILSLPQCLKIITVSFPLSDYSQRFVIDKQCTVSFPWGEADVFLNRPLGVIP